MIAEARRGAAEGDVYLDGGALLRAAHAAGLVDVITLTVVAVMLGQGKSLVAGSPRTTPPLVFARELGAGGVQRRYRLRERA